ncbi:hypothetical protein HHL09_20685 [Luteolibacter luteus]|uniref:Endonuclease/exonuclease/phosphatase domain-containing protein n=1 Tax=Luteolibacter luteus TaxID=2728835 RepID=A0A858RNU9_9BACT|nr:endonuclease/exonuclease/phosphatase family protein [Luteolibacter luteus]QJE98098.1 hypothetical protein HHL09_20685 [Luteolibacter luteus]
MEAQKDTVIVVGDMNATVWSQGMKPLKDAGLRGWEGIPTWSRENPLLAVPIDYVLYRKGESSFIESSGYEVGPDLGSDHRPVTRDLVW